MIYYEIIWSHFNKSNPGNYHIILKTKFCSLYCGKTTRITKQVSKSSKTKLVLKFEEIQSTTFVLSSAVTQLLIRATFKM